MPVLTDFTLPTSPLTLALPATPNAVFFISFHASPDPTTGKPWCPDVVAALPHLNEVFSAAHKPQVAFVDVGLRPEWKDLSNVYRTKWNVSFVPTLARYERVDGEVKEVGRLVEGEILDRARLNKFVGGELAKI
ncbi:hypothetical protein BDW59DRAFT_149738 [Aspergillus cavernicola]|uniref:Thioredoxin domain-containing protein n=1 Tax=Aspergillus cavernicola TaxID=176166 RepID=A0ABR4I347_9EURO